MGLGPRLGRPGARPRHARRRATWEDVSYPQLEGHLCAMMGRSGRTGSGRARHGNGQTGELRAGRVGGRSQVHEAGQVPRLDGLGALGRSARPGGAAAPDCGQILWERRIEVSLFRVRPRVEHPPAPSRTSSGPGGRGTEGPGRPATSPALPSRSRTSPCSCRWEGPWLRPARRGSRTSGGAPEGT